MAINSPEVSARINPEIPSQNSYILDQVSALYKGIMPFADNINGVNELSPLLTKTANSLGLNTENICNSFIELYTNPTFNNYSLETDSNKKTSIHAYLNEYSAKINAILATDLDDKNTRNVVFMRNYVNGLISKNEKHLSDEDKNRSAVKLMNKINKNIIAVDSSANNSNHLDALPLIVDLNNNEALKVWDNSSSRQISFDKQDANSEVYKSLISKLNVASENVNLPVKEMSVSTSNEEWAEYFTKSHLEKEQASEYIKRIKACRSYNKKLSDNIQVVHSTLKERQQQQEAKQVKSEKRGFFSRLFARAS